MVILRLKTFAGGNFSIKEHSLGLISQLMPSHTSHPTVGNARERIIRKQRPFTTGHKSKITDLRNRLSHNSTKRELQIAKSTLKLQSVYTKKLESLLQTHRETQETDRNYIQILENLTKTKDNIIEAKAEQIDICQEQILTLQKALVDKSKNLSTPNSSESKELKSYRKYSKSLEKAIAQSGKLIDHLQRQINPADSTPETPSSSHSQNPSFLQQPPQGSISHHPSSQSPSRDSPKDGKLKDGESIDDELEDGEVP